MLTVFCCCFFIFYLMWPLDAVGCIVAFHRWPFYSNFKVDRNLWWTFFVTLRRNAQSFAPLLKLDWSIHERFNNSLKRNCAHQKYIMRWYERLSRLSLSLSTEIVAFFVYVNIQLRKMCSAQVAPFDSRFVGADVDLASRQEYTQNHGNALPRSIQSIFTDYAIDFDRWISMTEPVPSLS